MTLDKQEIWTNKNSVGLGLEEGSSSLDSSDPYLDNPVPLASRESSLSVNYHPTFFECVYHFVKLFEI